MRPQQCYGCCGCGGVCCCDGVCCGGCEVACSPPLRRTPQPKMARTRMTTAATTIICSRDMCLPHTVAVQRRPQLHVFDSANVHCPVLPLVCLLAMYLAMRRWKFESRRCLGASLQPR